MTTRQSTVFCRTQFEGIHCWPNAPAEVYYLRSPHRHIFNVEVEVDVETNDREIEFIMLKHEVNDWLCKKIFGGHTRSDRGEMIWDLGSTSCESIANDLLDFLHTKYPTREMWVEVNEDGENGARVYSFIDHEDEDGGLDELF